jgi:hypothetical protein
MPPSGEDSKLATRDFLLNPSIQAELLERLLLLAPDLVRHGRGLAPVLGGEFVRRVPVLQ